MIDPTTKMNLFTQASSLGLEISKKQMYDDWGWSVRKMRKTL